MNITTPELASNNKCVIECMNIIIDELKNEISKLTLHNILIKNQISKNISNSNKILILTINNNNLKKIQCKYNKLLKEENNLKTTIINFQSNIKILQEKNDKLNDKYSHLLNKKDEPENYTKLIEQLKIPIEYKVLKKKFDSLLLLITELDVSELTNNEFYVKFKQELLLKCITYFL